jgi:hypothetical protein
MTVKTVAISQPGYLPYPGFFDKILRSDLFVFLDSVQYARRGWDNRNRIKTDRGPMWLTVPVKAKGNYLAKLSEIEIESGQNWIRKHLLNLETYYRRAPYYQEVYSLIEQTLAEGHRLLIDLNISIIRRFCSYMGLASSFEIASRLDAAGKGSDLILEICRSTGCTDYLSGVFGREYLDEESFREAGINIIYQEFTPPVYPQFYGDFISSLSIVDLLFHCGPSSAGVIQHKTRITES